MNKRRIMILVMASTAWGHAEPSGAPQPTEPFILQDRESAEWKVALSQPSSKVSKSPSGEAVPEPTEIKVELFDNLRRDVTTWSNGTSTESWFWKGMEFSDSADGGKHPVVILPLTQGSRFFGGYSDFPELAWIDLASYTGRETVNGRECFVYRYRPPGGEKPDWQASVLDSLPAERTAWIDVQSRLPVRVVMGSETQDFTHLAPPTKRLQLPQRYVAALEQITRRAERANKYLP